MARSKTIEFLSTSGKGSTGKPGWVSARSPISAAADELRPGRQQVVEAISDLCTESSRNATSYKIAARTAGDSLVKVMEAETNLKDAAISLGQEEILADLISELTYVLEACRECEGASIESDPGKRQAAGKASGHRALPQWWFALSEMLQITDREIGLLKAIGHGQPRNSPARQMCNIVVRVLRRHYQRMLLEAEEWMSTSDV
ncbi:MAG: hypothetical protein KJO98_10080 [Rhodothermia bacterium]|nr:hypothetical protein [Rhodothermia bacterium]